MEDKLYTKAEIEETEKGLLAVASTAVVDRHGEIVSVDGWNLKNFKKNPILLWGHDHYEPAIGTAKNIRVEGVGKKARLLFEPVFHDFTETSKALKRMVEEKIINSFSVGFRPLEVDGNKYTSQELLEISLVNVPANPDARMLAYKSLKQDGFKEEVIKEVTGIEDDKDKLIAQLIADNEETKEALKELQKSSEDLVKGLKHLNPEGRKNAVVTQRLALSKVIARAADKLLEDKPKGKEATFAKVIKKAGEQLIVDHKQELKSNGKN